MIRKERGGEWRQVVAAWNGMSISAFALAGRALQSENPPAAPSFPVEGRDPAQYLQAAVRVTPHKTQGPSTIKRVCQMSIKMSCIYYLHFAIM